MTTENLTSHTTDYALTLKNLSCGYNGRAVLPNINWQVPKGSVVGLIGSNGSGKSTLMRTLLGIQSSLNGTSTILGCPFDNINDDTRARLGYVPQKSTLIPWLTAGSMIEHVSSFYPSWDEDLVNDLIKRWKLPSVRK